MGTGCLENTLRSTERKKQPRVMLLSIIFLVLSTCSALVASLGDFAPMDRFVVANYNPFFNDKAWAKKNRPNIDYRPTGKVPQPANSGVTILNFNDQIVGGKKATRGQFPWQALLTLDGSYMCGGSLISTQWILTAAHCCHEITTFTVTLGIITKSGSESSKQVHTTKSKFVHKSYDDVYLTFDIALLRLPKTADISGPFVTPIRLPRIVDARKNVVAKTGMISGWGKIGDDDGPSDGLKFVQRRIVDNNVCVKLYGNISVSAATLCISNVDLQGTCNGDSGGPFVIMDDDKKYTQIGLVSFGSSYSCVKYPSCFTRVSSYLGWISNTTGLKINP